VGVLVAASLVTAYTFADAKLAELGSGEGTALVLPPRERAIFAGLYSTFVAALIALICTPLWLAMARWRLTGCLSAAVLGFVATMVFWVFNNLDGVTPVQDLARDGLVYAAFGAVSGVATWWTSPRGTSY
jgi:hypothetical protein